MATESVAEAYLDLLAARGIDYLFGNGGTDFGPIVEAYARRLAAEEPVPEPVTVPHEIAAVAMAHGHTMVSGRPQAVMVHTIPGTANAVGGIINASRAQIPMLFTAGRTPLTEGSIRGSRDGGIHWAQESFDQGSMVREWVKWDYELRSGSNVESIVDRALAIAKTVPTGPVYLTLPREVLAEEVEHIGYSAEARLNPSEMAAAPAAIEDAARVLASARNPIAIAHGSGRDTRTVSVLVELAELLGMGVFEVNPAYVNFPQNHPLHAGFDAQSALEQADAVLVLESDVPWSPKRVSPAAGATVIELGEDPLYSRYPVRGFPSDISLAGDMFVNLYGLLAAVKRQKVDASAAARRGERWHDQAIKSHEATANRVEEARGRTPILKQWFSHCVDEAKDADTIIINELGVDLSCLCFTEPGTLFGHAPSGGLGWALGAAAGAKLAAPDKTVVCAVGDGSYIFGCPEAVHWVSRAQGLPILFLVYNNAGWNAVASATRGLVPDGVAVKTQTMPFTDLSPQLDFEMFCQAAGGYGERVEDPEDLPKALERALHAVKVEGRQALLNIIGQRPT
jgi:acetolactate synthase I/II/III large subunit